MATEQSVVSALTPIIAAAANRMAARNDNSLDGRDAAEIAEVVTTELTAVVEHATNSETHWFQKRSYWSAIIAAATPLLGYAASRMGLAFGAQEAELLSTMLYTFGGVIASYLAYRAGTAKKPLGA